MGKSSGGAKQTLQTDLRQQGPGLSDPGPQLQLTALGAMPTGPIDFANGGFAAQIAALPEGLRQQIMAAGNPGQAAETPQPAPRNKLGLLGALLGDIFNLPNAIGGTLLPGTWDHTNKN